MAIFGAGGGGRKALAELLPDNEVVAFLDSRAVDGEGDLSGIPIRRPEAVHELNVEAVILASVHAGPMYHQLLALEFPGERIEIFPIWRLLPADEA